MPLENRSTRRIAHRVHLHVIGVLVSNH